MFPAGSLSLYAGNSSSSAASSIGGSITIAAGTASASGSTPFSFINVLGTNSIGTAGHISIFSTGTVMVQSPLLVTGSATVGSAASDVFTVNAALVASAAFTASSDMVVSGDIMLGAAAGLQTLTVNAATTFTAAAGSVIADAAFVANAVFTANSALLANDNLTVLGNTILGRSTGGQTLTVYSKTTFSAAAGLVAAYVPVAAHSGLSVEGLLNVSQDAVVGTNSQDSLIVNSGSVFASTVQMKGRLSLQEWPRAKACLELHMPLL